MRWLFRLVGAVVVLVLLGFVALALIPSERVARLAAEQFEAVTGRSLTIEGAVKPSLWPVLGVETGRITMGNAPWSEAGPMLVADGLSIRLDMAALTGGAVRITGFELTRPVILLERSREGLANWEFGGANGGTASGQMAGADKPFTLDLAVIREGRLRYSDHQAQQEFEIGGLEAEARLPDFAGPLALSLTGEKAGQAVAVSGTFEDFAAAYRGDVVPVVLAAQIGTADITFGGRGGGQPFALEGQVEAELGNLGALAAVLGMEAPALPEGFGARSVSLEGKVTRSAEGGLYLRGGRIGLDRTVLTGDLDVTFGGERPRVVGRLATPALTIGEGGEGGGSGGGGGAAAAGWSEAPLSAAGLRAVDVDLGLTVDALRLGSVRLSGLQSRITVDAGRAVVDLGRVGAYDGALSGQVVVNGRKGLSVGGKLDFDGVALQPLLTDVAGYDRLIGTGDLSLDFVAGGGSVAALMRGLDGQGRLVLGPGELRGIDMAAILATLDPSQTGPQESTVFDALTASFSIAGGVLENDDLKLGSPYVRAGGSGRVGLGERTLDYRLRATALQGADGADRIVVPILIRGSWDAPKVALDLEAIAQEQLGEQAKAAEDELRRRAAEALDQQDGESLEDAARRKVQDEIDKQAGDLLQQLLGGN